MNILTKICIVVLVVLCLFSAAVITTLATTGPNYKQAYTEQKTRGDVADLRAAQLQVVNSKLIADNEKANGDLSKEKLARAQDKSQAEKDLSSAKLESQKNERSAADLTASVNTLTTSLDTANKRTDALSKDLDAARKSADEKAADVSKLTQDVRAAQAMSDRKDRQIDQLNEQLTQANQQIQELINKKGAVPTTPGGVAAVSPSEATYTGEINAVQGDNASVNIGAANGVKRGDKLFVYRGGKYLGRLTIELVNTNDAAGILTDKQADVAKGDKVTNRLQ